MKRSRTEKIIHFLGSVEIARSTFLKERRKTMEYVAKIRQIYGLIATIDSEKEI